MGLKAVLILVLCLEGAVAVPQPILAPNADGVNTLYQAVARDFPAMSKLWANVLTAASTSSKFRNVVEKAVSFGKDMQDRNYAGAMDIGTQALVQIGEPDTQLAPVVINTQLDTTRGGTAGDIAMSSIGCFLGVVVIFLFVYKASTVWMKQEQALRQEMAIQMSYSVSLAMGLVAVVTGIITFVHAARNQELAIVSIVCGCLGVIFPLGVLGNHAYKKLSKKGSEEVVEDDEMPAKPTLAEFCESLQDAENCNELQGNPATEVCTFGESCVAKPEPCVTLGTSEVGVKTIEEWCKDLPFDCGTSVTECGAPATVHRKVPLFYIQFCQAKGHDNCGKLSGGLCTSHESSCKPDTSAKCPASEDGWLTEHCVEDQDNCREHILNPLCRPHHTKLHAAKGKTFEEFCGEFQGTGDCETNGLCSGDTRECRPVTCKSDKTNEKCEDDGVPGCDYVKDLEDCQRL